MKFGKLEDLSGIDFKLPDPQFILDPKFFPKQKEGNNPNLYLGGTGWSNNDWKGSLYPAKTPTTKFLQEYGKQFNSIELNTTHYRIPPPEMVLKWADSVPSDFKFSPKILQYISHSRMLGTDTDRIERFCESMRYFGPKLGPCFIQLPAHFGPEKLPILELFIETWPKDLDLSVELRHPDWFGRSEEMELLLGTLSSYNMGLVVTDVAGRRDVAHSLFLANHILVRFGGNYPHLSDENRLSQWSSFIQQSYQKGIQNFYFFSHQHNGNAEAIVRDLTFLHDENIRDQNIVGRHPKLIKPQATLF